MGNRIVVIGSINMDVINHVERHPLPGETVKGLGTEYSPGGKGANQAVAAALAGAQVDMVGAVGRDAFAATLLGSLQDRGVHTNAVTAKEGASGLAFITVSAAGENNIILSAGANGLLSVDDLERQSALLETADAVLLQNEIPWATTRAALELAKRKGARACLNAAPAFRLPEEAWPLVDVLVLNESEASVVTGLPVADAEQAEQAALGLIRGGVSAVVITLGEKGSLYVHRDGRKLLTPAFPVKAVDTTAAGDTFVGAFAAAGFGEGDMPADEALRFASAAAALTVTRKGAQQAIPGRAEIAAFLRERS